MIKLDLLCLKRRFLFPTRTLTRRNAHLYYLTYPLSWVRLKDLASLFVNFGWWFFWNFDHWWPFIRWRNLLLLECLNFIRDHVSALSCEWALDMGVLRRILAWILAHDSRLFLSTVEEILLSIQSFLQFGLSQLFLFWRLRLDVIQLPLLQALVVLAVGVIVDNPLLLLLSRWYFSLMASWRSLGDELLPRVGNFLLILNQTLPEHLWFL